MENERATKRQQELLAYVDGFIRDTGYGPSYREIMRALDYKSVSTVAVHIDGLIAKGYLVRRDKSARSLEVVMRHSSDSAAPAATQEDTMVEAAIIAKLATVKLSEQQAAQATELFTTLGFKRVVEAIDAKDTNA